MKAFWGIWLRPLSTNYGRLANKFVATTNWLSRASAAVGDVAIVVLMLSVSYEVVMRYVFMRPTIWSMELAGFLTLLVVFLGIAHVLQQEKHIRITAVIGKLPKKGQAALYLVAACLALIFSLILTKQGWNIAWASYQMHHLSEITGWPLFAPKLLIAIGGGLLSLQFIIQIGRGIRALVGKGSLDLKT